MPNSEPQNTHSTQVHCFMSITGVPPLLPLHTYIHTYIHTHTKHKTYPWS